MTFTTLKIECILLLSHDKLWRRTAKWERRVYRVCAGQDRRNWLVSFDIEIYKLHKSKHQKAHFLTQFPGENRRSRTGYGLTWKQFETLVIKPRATVLAVAAELGALGV